MSDLRWLTGNLHPQFPGGFGKQPGRIRHSGLREHMCETPRRGDTAIFRRSARAAYRKVFSHVESTTNANGTRRRVRVWRIGRPSLKQWLKVGAP